MASAPQMVVFNHFSKLIDSRRDKLIAAYKFDCTRQHFIRSITNGRQTASEKATIIGDSYVFASLGKHDPFMVLIVGEEKLTVLAKYPSQVNMKFFHNYSKSFKKRRSEEIIVSNRIMQYYFSRPKDFMRSILADQFSEIIIADYADSETFDKVSFYVHRLISHVRYLATGRCVDKTMQALNINKKVTLSYLKPDASMPDLLSFVQNEYAEKVGKKIAKK